MPTAQRDSNLFSRHKASLAFRGKTPPGSHSRLPRSPARQRTKTGHFSKEVGQEVWGLDASDELIPLIQEAWNNPEKIRKFGSPWPGSPYADILQFQAFSVPLAVVMLYSDTLPFWKRHPFATGALGAALIILWGGG